MGTPGFKVSKQVEHDLLCELSVIDVKQFLLLLLLLLSFKKMDVGNNGISELCSIG